MKTTVITGTTNGIGRVTARELVRAGHFLIMLVRDSAGGARLAEELRAARIGANVAVIRCDLASLDSIRTAAGEVANHTDHIDCLINNAGCVAMRRTISPDGFEGVFAANHLGPFLLTELLRNRIGEGGQIINVASRIHYKGSLDLGQVRNPDCVPYRPQAAYAQSKLANVLHTLALTRRLKDRGVRANCLHPGVVRSNLLPAWLRIVKPLITPGTIDVERGALSTLYLALDEGAAELNGAYIDEFQRLCQPARLAQDEALQDALWLASERWVGIG